MAKTGSEPAEKQKPTPGVLKGALFFGLGTLSSRIFGLIRDALLGAYLPLDTREAWLMAFRAPNAFRRLLGEGGLSASFLPVFVGSLETENPKDVRTLVNGAFTLLFSVASILCVLALIFMPELIGVWVGDGFKGVPGKTEMTIDLARIMFGFLLGISLFAYFMALLNGVKQFALTGFAPLMLNLAIIAAVWWGRDSPDIGIYAGFGVLAGGFLQALFLVPAVRRAKLLPRYSWAATKHPLVRKVLRRFLPAVVGLGVIQLLAFINTGFASRLGSGAVNAIYYGDRLLELPLSLISVSIGTALLPSLSGLWAKNDKKSFGESLVRHIRLFLFLGLPCAGGLWFLGTDIISVLFKRGEFTQEQAEVVGGILKIYGMTLLCAGSLRIFNQGFYAAQDTTTPAKIAAVSLVIHCVMAPFWMDYWGILGLCFSTALTTLLSLKISAWVGEKRFGLPGKLKFVTTFFKTSLATALMCVFLFYAQPMIPAEGHFLLRFGSLILAIVVAATLFFAACMALKVDDAKIVGQKLSRRFLKKL